MYVYIPHITGGIPHISGGRINLPSGMHPGPMRNLVSDESLWAPAQLCLLLVTPMRIWAIIANNCTIDDLVKLELLAPT